MTSFIFEGPIQIKNTSVLTNVRHDALGKRLLFVHVFLSYNTDCSFAIHMPEGLRIYFANGVHHTIYVSSRTRASFHVGMEPRSLPHLPIRKFFLMMRILTTTTNSATSASLMSLVLSTLQLAKITSRAICPLIF